MSEHFPPRGRHHEQAVDRLLADSGLDGDDDLRTELLELRALAGTTPLPSDAVRALMVSGPAAVTQQITTADGPAASSGAPTAVLTTVGPASRVPADDHVPGGDRPADELAVRRRTKRRTAIAGLAVVVSLAGGATAAAASEGGIPGAFQHLGAAIGSVVSQLTPGSGNVPQPDGPAGPAPAPTGGDMPAAPRQNEPVPAAPNHTGSPAPGPRPEPGGVAPSQAPKTPSRPEPGNGSIPTPPVIPVAPPGIDPSKADPTKLRPSDLPVPNVPVPGIPAK
ncbi:hypothetical protein QF015_003379 [Paenarthrobacter sp. TE4293]|uniref:hypothetical protein n=1 Tax=Paenarthrobacter sp. TE4293 TaxID=3381695 RepID=UPI003D2437B9